VGLSAFHCILIQRPQDLLGERRSETAPEMIDMARQVVYRLDTVSCGVGNILEDRGRSVGLMAKNASHVTEAEFTVLEALWQTAGQSARELTERLYPACTPADVATVHKLLERLEAKGLVVRDRSGRVYRFSAAIPRTKFAGQQLSQLADKLSGGSLTPLLVHLVEIERLSRGELDELRALFMSRKR
jgi:BlaI family transcriptional regulator, penicillinase repressor